MLPVSILEIDRSVGKTFVWKEQAILVEKEWLSKEHARDLSVADLNSDSYRQSRNCLDCQEPLYASSKSRVQHATSHFPLSIPLLLFIALY